MLLIVRHGLICTFAAGVFCPVTNAVLRYPFDKEALVGAEEQGPLLVDVGGGKGQDVKKVLAKFPETAGRIVLQDQQSVIDDVQKSDTALSEVACQAHDFFTPQPVQGEWHQKADCSCS